MDLLLLPLRDFVTEKCHTRSGGNWIKNEGETEGGTMCPPPPQTYIITKYPSLNRVKYLRNGIFVKYTKRFTEFTNCNLSGKLVELI